MSALRTLHPEEIRAMGSTTRWHTRRTLARQNLLEHSGSVALHAVFLAGSELAPSEELALLRLALAHDAHEPVYGDIPRPARHELAKEGIDLDGICRRRFWGGRDPYLEVSDHVLDLLEVADVLDAALWARDNAPDIADKVMAEAAQEAHKRLVGGPLARALEALGIWGGGL